MIEFDDLNPNDFLEIRYYDCSKQVLRGIEFWHLTTSRRTELSYDKSFEAKIWATLDNQVLELVNPSSWFWLTAPIWGDLISPTTQTHVICRKIEGNELVELLLKM